MRDCDGRTIPFLFVFFFFVFQSRIRLDVPDVQVRFVSSIQHVLDRDGRRRRSLCDAGNASRLIDSGTGPRLDRHELSQSIRRRRRMIRVLVVVWICTTTTTSSSSSIIIHGRAGSIMMMLCRRRHNIIRRPRFSVIVALVVSFDHFWCIDRVVGRGVDIL